MASELSRSDRGWVEAGTTLYFEKQPDKAFIPRRGESFCSYEVVRAGAYDALRQQQTTDQLCIKAQANELGRLRQQLEQSQQLVTDGQEAIGHWQGEYEQVRQRVEELTNLQGQPQCWNVEHMELESKLATAQARILELEQALRLHLAVAKDDPILLQHDRKEPS